MILLPDKPKIILDIAQSGLLNFIVIGFSYKNLIWIKKVKRKPKPST